MKTLVILGSPRKKGNSETAVVTVIDELSTLVKTDVEYVRLAKLDISPCIGCGGCDKTGMCVVKDDMIDMYGKIDEADLVFLVAPTYFYGLNAQIKAFIDRIQARWSRKYLLKIPYRPDDARKGCLVCTAATHGKKLFDGSVLVAKSFFDAVDIPYGGDLLIRGVDGRGEFAEDVEETEKAKTWARDIAAHFRR